MELTPLATLPSRLGTRGRDVAPGLLVCVAIAAVATVIGSVAPVLGAAIPAVILGVLISLVRRPSGRVSAGITYSSKFVLQCAVVLLGAQLSLAAIAHVGARSLPVMLTSLAVCLIVAWLLGRALRVERDLVTLIGVGTAICGASAIAAVSPVIRAKNAQIAYAVSTIFLFNLLAILLFPFVGHLLDMSPDAFGLFAGTAVNDTSSVVAAASVFGSASLGFAVVVKLVRTLMIVPISIGLAVVDARRRREDAALTPRRILKLVPWFLIGFVVVALINSAGLIGPGLGAALTHVSVFFVAVALAGIGLSTDVAAIRTAGWRPLVLGGALWIAVTGTTIIMMFVSGYL